MRLLSTALVLSAVTLASTGCLLGRQSEHSERVVVVERKPERVVVVERQPPPPVVVERVVVVQQEPAVVYREVYVEGRPAPHIRVEVVTARPRQDAVWVQGRWEHEKGDHRGHDDRDNHGHDDHWGWHGGYWR